MNPLTVLLWLLYAFVVAVFFGVIGLFVYMVKARMKALKEFNAHRAAMGLQPSNDVKAAMHSAKRSAEHKPFTKGTSQGG
ncbi:hypothetical protein [Acinetobacter sp. Ac_5812]|uniref:hypothetical protein n=1 Tax=Acinetobacter sp. Ac_5812 TaxID=1848937 RepID=UPI0014904B72|nr:hypothetical protein [Acinetobacter sp. Ac_5812]NNP68948.1 hypothetical protein [Acinetobacter sp. Ac_5812]